MFDIISPLKMQLKIENVELRIGRRRIPMPAGVGYLTRPALGCLDYQIFILGARP